MNKWTILFLFSITLSLKAFGQQIIDYENTHISTQIKIESNNVSILIKNKSYDTIYYKKNSLEINQEQDDNENKVLIINWGIEMEGSIDFPIELNSLPKGDSVIISKNIATIDSISKSIRYSMMYNYLVGSKGIKNNEILYSDYYSRMDYFIVSQYFKQP